MIDYPVAVVKQVATKLNGVEGRLVNAPGILPLVVKVSTPSGEGAWVLRVEPSVNGLPVLPVVIPVEFSFN
jgi:hypothetical protein